MSARTARPHEVVVLCIAVASGCGESPYFSYGMPTVLGTDVPPPRKPIIGGFGVDFGVGNAGNGIWDTALAGVTWFPDAHHEHIWGLYAGLDPVLGLYSRTASYAAGARPFFPTLKPILGMWFWVESPHNAGLLSGVRAGIGKVVNAHGPNAAIGFEYQVLFLQNVLDGKSASVQSVVLTLTWSP